MDIKLIDFKVFSGRYKLAEKNGTGIEFNLNNGIIRYAGEYLNYKRNGKGEEYDSVGNLIFEGEFLNGKKKKEKKAIIGLNGVLFLKENNLNGNKWTGIEYSSIFKK